MVTPEGKPAGNIPLEFAGGSTVLAVVSPPSPEEAAQINKLLEGAFTKVLGRLPRVSFATGEDQGPTADIYENPDVRQITADIKAHLDDRRASVSLLAGWRRFLFAKQHELPLEDHQIINGIVVEQVESLGSRISSAVFLGPSRTHVMLGRDAFSGVQNMDVIVANLIAPDNSSSTPTAQFQLRISYK